MDRARQSLLGPFLTVATTVAKRHGVTVDEMMQAVRGRTASTDAKGASAKLLDLCPTARSIKWPRPLAVAAPQDAAEREADRLAAKVESKAKARADRLEAAAKQRQDDKAARRKAAQAKAIPKKLPERKHRSGVRVLEPEKRAATR